MTCPWCGEEALGSDDFIGGEQRFHRECILRSVIGSAAHQLRECTCYGGSREDPPNMTRRQAAKLAQETFNLLQSQKTDVF